MPRNKAEYRARRRPTLHGRAEALTRNIYTRVHKRHGNVKWGGWPKTVAMLRSKLTHEVICPLCLRPMSLAERGLFAISVDRMDTKRGYFKDNTQLTHVICNRLKGELPQPLVAKYIKRIVEDLHRGYIYTYQAGKAGKFTAKTAHGKAVPQKQKKKAGPKPKAPVRKANKPRA